MFWNKEIECADREQMRELQGRKLAGMVKRMYDNVPFYKNKFDEIGLVPGDIKNVDQIGRASCRERV